MSSHDIKLLDVPAVVALTGVPLRTVRHLFDTRALPLVHIGRRLFVRQSALEDYLAANTHPARADR